MAGFEQNLSNGEDEPISTINIVPFVDIVLVLLIIFMLTAAAIIKASFQVNLPRAANAGQNVKSTLNIILTKENQIFLNGKESSRENLAAFVRQEAQTNADLQAVISADTIAAYGKVIDIIDILKGNGVKSFALNIERKADR